VPVSCALVATDRPDRYAKQLAEHLGRRNAPVTEPGGTRLIFTAGSCLLSADADGLLLIAEAEDDAGLDAVQQVVSRHLERMGRRDELLVQWARTAGAESEG
jgi:hypothetical protein